MTKSNERKLSISSLWDKIPEGVKGLIRFVVIVGFIVGFVALIVHVTKETPE